MFNGVTAKVINVCELSNDCNFINLEIEISYIENSWKVDRSFEYEAREKRRHGMFLKIVNYDF